MRLKLSYVSLGHGQWRSRELVTDGLRGNDIPPRTPDGVNPPGAGSPAEPLVGTVPVVNRRPPIANEAISGGSRQALTHPCRPALPQLRYFRPSLTPCLPVNCGLSLTVQSDRGWTTPAHSALRRGARRASAIARGAGGRAVRRDPLPTTESATGECPAVLPGRAGAKPRIRLCGAGARRTHGRPAAHRSSDVTLSRNPAGAAREGSRRQRGRAARPGSGASQIGSRISRSGSGRETGLCGRSGAGPGDHRRIPAMAPGSR